MSTMDATAPPSNPAEPLNTSPQPQPNYSATSPLPPPAAGQDPAYPPPGVNPPKYAEVLQSGDQQVQGPPPGHPYAPGPGPAPMPGPAPVTTVNYQAGQTTIVATPCLSFYPVAINCPSCHQNVTTRVTYVPGTLTWLIALLMCLVGLFLGCCLIPFCIDGCKDVVHSCSNCGHALGTYRRI